MEWVGTPVVLGSSPTIQYVLVTISLAGLQFVWSIEQAYVNVYLLDLGMTKASLSLIWLAGPVCGLIIQPVIGVLSDHSTSSHGRRRPFMIWGSLCVALGLLVFAWAREFARPLGVSPVWVAVMSVLLIDVAVNTCQACSRALIVDMFSASRQADANAWASRMSSVGHLISFYLGSLDLTKLGFASQMKSASVFSSVILIVCVVISSTAVKERTLIRTQLRNSRYSAEISDLFSQLWHTTLSLDPALKSIFRVQVLAWYGWFTFLFYGSTYASEVWSVGRSETPSTGDLARAGSLAMAVFSFSATNWTILLPWLSSDMINLWTISLLFYAAAVLASYWAFNYSWVLVMFVVVGFSWASSLWVPFALTSKRIHELPELTILTEADDEQVLPSDSHSISEAEEDLPSSLHLINSLDVPDGRDEQSGIILGIHNSALTFPQLISSFGSYVIFQLLDADPKNPHGDGGRAIAVTLQVGAITSLLAAFYSRKVKKFAD
nr:Sut1 [Starmerella bombicola]